MSENGNGGTLASFLAGLIIGGFVGAIAALLLAPQSGEETRTLIHDKGIELKDKAAVSAEEISKLTQERAAELQKRGQMIIEEQKTRISTKSGDEVVEDVEEVAVIEPEEDAEA